MKYLKERLGQYTILIVEDDVEVRVRLKNTLSFYFKKVYEADNAKEGYEIFELYKPDLLLSDIEMANGNGIELVNKIRKSDRTTPIIILSAYSKEEYLLGLINLNIDQYILKPASSASLFAAIKKALLLDSERIIELNSLVRLDINNNILYCKSQEITLRKKEKDFLLLLHENKNSITKYALIEERIWVDKIMTSDALKTFIKELRRKLPCPLIENIVQEGYRLTKSDKID